MLFMIDAVIQVFPISFFKSHGKYVREYKYCRFSSEKFNAAGQNIGSGGKWGGYLTPVELINKNFGKDGLFIEYKNANMSYINKFRFHDE